MPTGTEIRGPSENKRLDAHLQVTADACSRPPPPPLYHPLGVDDVPRRVRGRAMAVLRYIVLYSSNTHNPRRKLTNYKYMNWVKETERKKERERDSFLLEKEVNGWMEREREREETDQEERSVASLSQFEVVGKAESVVRTADNQRIKRKKERKHTTKEQP